jgi:hypothetical protein
MTPKKIRFQNEDRQHPVADQRACHVPDLVHQVAPKAAKLNQQRNRGSQSQHKRKGEDAHPETVRGNPGGLFGIAGAQLEKQQHPGQRKRHRQEKSEEAQAAQELRTGKEKRRNIHDRA